MATYTFLQSASDTANATTYTFSSQNLGTADAARYIVVGISTRGVGSAHTVSSVSVGGVSATIIVQVTQDSSNSNISAIAIAAVPSGTTGDVVVVFSAGMLRANIGLWSLIGIESTAYDFDSAIATGSTSVTTSLDVPAAGFAIGHVTNGSAPNDTTWSGITERYDDNVEVAIRASGASDTFGTLQTGLSISASYSSAWNLAHTSASFQESTGGGGLSIPIAMYHYTHHLGTMSR